MTLKELEQKLQKGQIYAIESKKDDGDGFPGEPGCPMFVGRCRLTDDGRLECSIRENTFEKCPQGNYFFIDTDKGLEPWRIKIGDETIE